MGICTTKECYTVRLPRARADAGGGAAAPTASAPRTATQATTDPSSRTQRWTLVTPNQPMPAPALSSVSPGANDNATGVAAVFAAARYATNSPYRSKSLSFVLFDGEEVPGNEQCIGRLRLSLVNGTAGRDARGCTVRDENVVPVLRFQEEAGRYDPRIGVAERIDELWPVFASPRRTCCSIPLMR